MTQLFGSWGGHDGSSSYCGTRRPPFCADTADPRPNAAAAAATSSRTDRMLRTLRLMWPPRARCARQELLAPQMPVQQLLGELDALEVENLDVLFGPPHERHADLPGPGEHLGVLDRDFVHDHVRTGRRVPLDDVQRVGGVVACPVEPRLAVESGNVHDERVA